MFPSSKNVLDKGCILKTGMEAGKKEGWEAGKREMAINMMKNHMSLETIAQMAEIPLEIVEKWKREYLDKS